MHQMCCSVHDFPRRPSWEARSQQDHFGIECLIPQTAESLSGIASDFSPSIFFFNSFTDDICCSCACPDDTVSRNVIAEAGGYVTDIERDGPGFMDLFQSADSLKIVSEL